MSRPRGSTPFLTVFDLDGTLVDSRKDLADSANELVESYGGPPLPDADIARMVGDGVAALVSRVLARASLQCDGEEALARYLGIYDRRMLTHTRPYSGIPEAVAAAGQWGPVAVLTNKPGQPTRRILQAFNLTSQFLKILGGDDGYPRKPAPEGLWHLMAIAGTSRMTTLMVGDSLVDVEVARRASVRVCVARYGFGFDAIEPKDLSGDELFVDRAGEIAELLERIAG